jgi:hypothetical protein
VSATGATAAVQVPCAPAEAFEAAAERIFAVVADDPFDTWLERPPESFLLTST